MTKSVNWKMKDAQISKASSKHTGVISLFDTEFVIKGIFPKELSKDFHKAFELRQRSDYKVIKLVTSERADEIVQKTEQFLEAVKTYFLKDSRII